MSELEEAPAEPEKKSRFEFPSTMDRAKALA